ncbi:DUF1214 domain-containing protein (plasmid) [Rhizobium sp. CB3171]|uniref:DUF1214 domain-containing protein n=1 Tax=Rhizobium sp. CB3171 TaxID=3039157 RepID=UPI0024B224EB|nr:DUF1214 domain-containing protein [Rhizobium sp. CB3171]WFU05062.1 DUF1214 domain-containing protein [Rhizobium sp. CB3171]
MAYSQRLKTYPLAEAAKPHANRYIDAYPKAWKTLPAYDLTYLRLLAETIDADPPQDKDAVMLAMLATIGIEKGKPFNPQGEQAQLLKQAVREGAAQMNDYFLNRALVPFSPGWLGLRLEGTFGYTYYGNGKLDYDARAGNFYWATWAPKRTGDPEKLPASAYLFSFRDKSEQLYRGDRLYRVRMPADTPARDFWSIIAYEVGTNAFIHNPQNRVGVSSYDKAKLAVNKDGSVDVYIGAKPPAGFENNWVPTAGKDFWLAARFYGPLKPLFDKTWVMADVEEVK